MVWCRFHKLLHGYFIIRQIIRIIQERTTNRTHFSLNYITYRNTNGQIVKIHSDNFLFGLGAAEEHLHIIDFGFCKKYNSNSFPSKTSNVIGTPKFASIAAHELNELSRHDDLESVGYILIYLFMGELAWDNIVNNNEIKIMKLHMIEFDNTKIPSIFINYLITVRKMAFYETPNYEKLLSNLIHDTNN
jgi:serine/threonine protein kinase